MTAVQKLLVSNYLTASLLHSEDFHCLSLGYVCTHLHIKVSFWNDNDLQYVLETCQENIVLILELFFEPRNHKMSSKTIFGHWLSPVAQR